MMNDELQMMNEIMDPNDDMQKMQNAERTTQNVISLRDINKTYPGAVPMHVLKDVSLDIRRGELVSIMGASGSGKSTLLNILGILDNYDSGTYTLDGVQIKDLSVFREVLDLHSIERVGAGIVIVEDAEDIEEG